MTYQAVPFLQVTDLFSFAGLTDSDLKDHELSLAYLPVVLWAGADLGNVCSFPPSLLT